MPNFLVSTWEDSGQTAISIPTATDFAGSAIAPRVDSCFCALWFLTCQFPGESFGRF